VICGLQLIILRMIADAFIYGLTAFFEWLNVFTLKNAWPTVALLLIIIFFFVPWPRKAILALAKSTRIRQISVYGTSIEFSSEGRDAIIESIDDLMSAIHNYRIKLNKYVFTVSQRYGLKKRFDDACEEIFEEFFDKNHSETRAAIHVQDYVFEERLYQLVDYYALGGGKGRHFSLRRGIIGRCWRSQIASSAGYLTTRVYAENSEEEGDELSRICEEWGLERSEALHFKMHPAYCCVPIIYNEQLVGLFYIDSKRPNFGWDCDADTVTKKLEEIETKVKDVAKKYNIDKTLSDIEFEVSKYAPRQSLDKNYDEK